MARLTEIRMNPDPIITDVVERSGLGLNDFRSSESMKVLFCRIAESSIVPTLSSGWNYESVKRLTCWMKVLINFLNIPVVSSFTGVGSYFTIPSGVRQQFAAPENQMDSELVVSLKYLLVMGLTLAKESEAIYIDTGCDENLDSARIDMVVSLIVFRLSSFVPWHLTIFDACPFALKYVTCGILGVKALSDDIIEAINKINVSIRSKLHTTEFAELLHNEKVPAVSSILRTYICKYMRIIRSNSSRLTKYCRDNDVKSSLEKRIVAELKSEVYDSPRDVIRIFQRKYKAALTSVPIPLQSLLVRDIKQAMKDIQRERMIINGEAYLGTSDTASSPVISASDGRQAVKFDALERIVALISKLIFGMELSYTNQTDKSFAACCERGADIQCTTAKLVPTVQGGSNTVTLTAIPGGLEPAVASPNSVEKMPVSQSSLDASSTSSSALQANPSQVCDAVGVATGTLEAHGLHSIVSPPRNFSVEHLVAFLSDDSGITPSSKAPSEQLNQGSHENSLNSSPRTALDAICSALSADGDDILISLAGTYISKGDSPLRSKAPSTPAGLQSSLGDVSDCESITTNNSSIPYSRSTSLSSAFGIDEDLFALPRTMPPVSQVIQSVISANRQQKLAEDVQLKENLLKLLLNYVILAACRTTAGGDAFVLLNHLYGGEGLALCPCRSNDTDIYSTKIRISDNSIVVSLHDRYNLIPVDDIGDTTQILMSFVCTTTTQISLSRFATQNSESGSVGRSVNVEALCKALISNPETLCKQFVSLRPELPN